jgi:MFS family permease
VLIPLLKAKLGLGDAPLGLVLLAFAGGAMVSMPLTGWLTGRIGTGRVAALSGLGFSGSILLPPGPSTWANLRRQRSFSGPAKGPWTWR